MKREASSGRGRVARDRSAFTLIEIMIVVAIMAVIVAMGLPPMLEASRPDPLRKAATDLREACNTARKNAILNSTTTEVVFHPLQKQFEVGGAVSSTGPGPAGTGIRLPDNIEIEMLDVNLQEYREKDIARVKFFPNGTSDDMTVVFVDNKKVRRAVSLEITTGLADIITDVDKLLSK